MIDPHAKFPVSLTLDHWVVVLAAVGGLHAQLYQAAMEGFGPKQIQRAKVIGDCQWIDRAVRALLVEHGRIASAPEGAEGEAGNA